MCVTLTVSTTHYILLLPTAVGVLQSIPWSTVFSILSVGLLKLLFELFLITDNQNDSCHLLKCTGSAVFVHLI